MSATVFHNGLVKYRPSKSEARLAVWTSPLRPVRVQGQVEALIAAVYADVPVATYAVAANDNSRGL